jgi:hypothetical protein
MTVKELREILERYEGIGRGDMLVIVSRGDAIETWDKVDDVIPGDWERTSKHGGQFTYDPDGEDEGGCNALWLAESLCR